MVNWSGQLSRVLKLLEDRGRLFIFEDYKV